jgi:hypothetical protein
MQNKYKIKYNLKNLEQIAGASIDNGVIARARASRPKKILLIGVNRNEINYNPQHFQITFFSFSENPQYNWLDHKSYLSFIKNNIKFDYIFLDYGVHKETPYERIFSTLNARPIIPEITEDIRGTKYYLQKSQSFSEFFSYSCNLVYTVFRQIINDNGVIFMPKLQKEKIYPEMFKHAYYFRNKFEFNNTLPQSNIVLNYFFKLMGEVNEDPINSSLLLNPIQRVRDTENQHNKTNWLYFIPSATYVEQ